MAAAAAALPHRLELSLKLKLDAGKLTGTLTSPGRGGGDPVDTAISNGKLDGDKISFSIFRVGINGSTAKKYEGLVAGDTFTGTQPAGRGGRGRGGNGGGGGGGAGATPPAPIEWIAKKSK